MKFIKTKTKIKFLKINVEVYQVKKMLRSSIKNLLKKIKQKHILVA